jgi:hypothetical protein
MHARALGPWGPRHSPVAVDTPWLVGYMKLSSWGRPSDAARASIATTCATKSGFSCTAAVCGRVRR